MRLRFAVALLVSGSLSLAARAQSILYTVQDTASGTIGSQSFTGQNITVQFAGDISNIAGSPGFYTNTPGVGTINIPSLGTFTFTDGTYFFDNQSVGAAGIADSSVGSILDTFNTAFDSYTGNSSIGPLSGNVFYASSYDFNTTGGVLNFSSAGQTSTLTASTSATPEPSSLALLGSGVLGLAGIIRRRLS